MLYRKRRPDAHNCGEKMCLNCEDYVDPNTNLCYLKPIKFEDDEQEQEEQGKKNKKRKNKRRRRRLSEEMVSDEVEEDGEEEEEEEEEEEAGREYLFFDIESRQDEGRHVANLLIVQDETGFEVVLKGDECVDQFGTWLLDGTHEGSIVIAHSLRGYDGFLTCEYF